MHQKMETVTVTRPVPPPGWSLKVVVGTALLSCASCGAPPAEYEPLPLVAVSPVVLDDTDEMRDYINAFPVDDYRQYEMDGVGRFFIDDPTDMIKQVVVAGDAWERHSLEVFDEQIESGTVVIEVGAHIGTHTVPIARGWVRGVESTPSSHSGRSIVSCTTTWRSTASPTSSP